MISASTEADKVATSSSVSLDEEEDDERLLISVPNICLSKSLSLC